MGPPSPTGRLASPVLFGSIRLRLRRNEIHAAAKRMRDLIGGGSDFTCFITDDPELQRLNATFRRVDHPTDVLSFPAPTGVKGSLGEIAISVDRAQEQAREEGHSIEVEIQILLLHGLLHLLGFDHERDAGEMKAEETRWRQALALPLGLIERSA